MVDNKLKLNDNKTEVITFSSNYKPPKKITLQIGNATVDSAHCVRLLRAA